VKPAVLIVDDSLTVRMNLGEAFELAGFDQTLCATLSEARQALERKPYSLVVLDVLLPDGDGVEFLREIRTNFSSSATPVILLSSEAEVRDRIRGLKTGADDYVGKPYDLAYVVARARELLPRSGSASDAEQAKPVLLIDDSRTFREALRAALESAGLAVLLAETGEDGLRSAVSARPAAIVVDGVLPGIDGQTVIRRIRADAALRSTPCILLTASEEQSGELRALEAGADAYVRKEENMEIILARVTAVLRSSGSSSMVSSTSSLLGPKRILTVDDSITYLEGISTHLHEEGYEVIPAHSGEEALELLAVQPVDCILLDLAMPGLSGNETCRRIKGSPSWRDIPLILHTATEEQEAMIEGINAGADDYIPKSSDLEVLRARVRAQLRRKQFEDENRSIREQLLQKELEIATANSARELAEARSAFVDDLERKNRELEAFSYSVSHDLRAPLRSIAGFSEMLIEDYAEQLDQKGQDYLRRVYKSVRRMDALIDDLLMLSRVSRAELRRSPVDLSRLAGAIMDDLRAKDPARQVQFSVAENLVIEADNRLMNVVFENLLGNAWKFSAKTAAARIEIGIESKETGDAFFVRDNGAGFDMNHAQNLFRPFQRLHDESDFAGTGIGLATVHRIIDRHGGRLWAEAEVNRGATFYFTIPAARPGGVW
jgi:two-component system, NtrC family, sensor kinase